MPDDVILVTGGAGFIGSCFVRQWLRETSGQLVNLDKLTYAASLASVRSCQADPRYRFVRGDIADLQLLKDLLAAHRPWAIVHFAAESHVDRSIDAPDAFFETNVRGTFNLLKATLHFWQGLGNEDRHRFRFLNVSTDEIYGSADRGQRFVKDSPLAPNSPYSASKAAADHFARAFHRTFGLPVLHTACCNNYGPFQFPEKLIPLIILRACAGKPLPVYGDGRQCRQWIHVEDHCAALRAVLSQGRPGEMYHIAGSEPQPNIDIVRRLCQIVDTKCPQLPHVPSASLIQFVADRPGHDRLYWLDDSETRQELAWSPAYDLDTGLEQTVDWYVAHATWVQEVSHRYHGERLGRLRS
jgi:dTDP-glucose 4,6-dehydratase